MLHEREAELIAEIRRVADIVERTPRSTDLKEHAEMPPSRFTTTFGSLTMAQYLAGFRPPRAGTLPQDILLTELDAVCEEAGGAVTTREFDKQSILSSKTYINTFDGWNDALRAIGRDPVKTNERDVSREEVIEIIRTVGTSMGRTPTREEIVERTDLKRDYLSKYYGTYSELVQAAGFEPNRRPSG